MSGETEEREVIQVGMVMVFQAHLDLQGLQDRSSIALQMATIQWLEARVCRDLLVKQDSQARWDQRVREVTPDLQAMVLRERKENLVWLLDLMEARFILVDYLDQRVNEDLLDQWDLLGHMALPA